MTTDPADMGEHDQLGCITWLSSEDDGGPDCGLVLGLGAGRSLYVGELADMTIAEAGLDPKEYSGVGWWCALQTGDGLDVVGPVASAEAARNMVDQLAAVFQDTLAHLASLEAENKALRETVGEFEELVGGCVCCPEAEYDALKKLERLVYVPGLRVCAKCGLNLITSTLYAQTGDIAANNSPQDCPNGCGPMWPKTERQAGNELCDSLDAEVLARQAAESRLSSVAGLVEAATALAPVQDPELPPDAHCILTVRLSASSTVKMPLGEWGKFMALREALDALGQ